MLVLLDGVIDRSPIRCKPPVPRRSPKPHPLCSLESRCSSSRRVWTHVEATHARATHPKATTAQQRRRQINWANARPIQAGGTWHRRPRGLTASAQSPGAQGDYVPRGREPRRPSQFAPTESRGSWGRIGGRPSPRVARLVCALRPFRAFVLGGRRDSLASQRHWRRVWTSGDGRRRPGVGLGGSRHRYQRRLGARGRLPPCCWEQRTRTTFCSSSAPPAASAHRPAPPKIHTPMQQAAPQQWTHYT